MRVLRLIMCVVVLAPLMVTFAKAWGQDERGAARTRPAGRFAYVDVFVDPQGKALAAYQIEFAASAGTKIVSLEGGEHAAFKSAPFYDPAALSHNRVVIAAYSTGDALPAANTRIARIHLQTTGAIDSQIKLVVAGSKEAKSIPAEVTFREGAAQ